MYEEEGNENNTTVPNILYALKRYKWHLCVTIIPLFTAAVAIIVSLPPIYLSRGVVLVETQQIPTDLVRSTVTSAASERIQVIRTRVMTREKLLDIVEKYPYFPLSESSPIEVEALLDQVREAIEIDVVESQQSHRGPETAISFTVGFNSKSPFIAQAVANDLVTLFLSENVKARTERATETTEFLRREAEKIKEELDKTELAVAEFKQKNKDSLPEHLDLYVDMRERISGQLEDINRDIRSTNDQIKLLNTQLALRSQNSAAVGSRAERLAELKTRYRELSLVYKPTYPDLVALKEQIELLESDSSPEGGDPLFSEAELTIESQVTSMQSTVDALLRERAEVEAELADLEARILNIPIVERGLTSLNRDYQSKLEQYNSIRAKTMDASMAESLEEGRKAERFSIVEPPILPRIPVAPDRGKLLAVGIAGAFGLPLGIVMLIGFLDKTIRNRELLVTTVGNVSIVETPYISDENERLSFRKRLKITLTFVVVALIAALLFIHFFYMPLGIFASKFLARFGVY